MRDTWNVLLLVFALGLIGGIALGVKAAETLNVVRTEALALDTLVIR